METSHLFADFTEISPSTITCIAWLSEKASVVLRLVGLVQAESLKL